MFVMKYPKIMLAVGISLTVLGVQAATNLVSGASFESASSTSLTGWTQKNNGTVGVFVGAGTGGAPANYIDLDSTKRNGSGFFNNTIDQSIVGTGLVQLSFWYAASAVDPGSTNKIKFSLGDLKGSVLNQAVNNTEWQQFTSQPILLIGNGNNTLSFSAAGKADGIGGYIGNVAVTAVPEPETYVMLLAGLGLVGAVARRRKQAPGS
jgi:hypothetical protein